MRRLLTGVVATVVALLVAAPAMAQSYPAKPIRLVVPYPAGTGTDIAARFLGDALAKSLGQPVVIDNRAGANGSIGTAAVAKSAPDGYTLLMGNASTNTMNAFLYQNLGYDAEADFEPVSRIAVVPLVIAVNAALPIHSVQDLIAAAKAKPGAINVAHPSVTALIALEYLKQRGGAPLFGIPYKGSPTALADVVGGTVQVIIDSIAAVRPFITSGKLRPLAVTSLKSTDLLPGVPAVAEQGLAGFEFVGWIAVFAPRGTPPEAIATLNAEFSRLLSDPAARKRVLDFGMQPVSAESSQQFGAFVRGEREKWGPIIKSGNIRAE